MPQFQFIRVEEDNRVLRLTLMRPPLNILNIAMLGEINVALDDAAANSKLCALVLAAEGDHFSAGVDIPEHRAETVRTMLDSVHSVLVQIWNLTIPTIAVVHGGVYGGGLELAMACDTIIASDESTLGLPEITLGVFPPFAAAMLGAMIGPKRAMHLVLSGRTIGTPEALQIGLIHQVYPRAGLTDGLEAYLARLRSLSSFSLRQAKRACRVSERDALDSALAEVERIYLEQLMAGKDPTEGITAFIEKRTPVWRHE